MQAQRARIAAALPRIDFRGGGRDALPVAAPVRPPAPSFPRLAVTRRRLLTVLQVLGSILVLVLLIRDAQWTEVWNALALVAPGWLLAAMAVKAVAVGLRELRLWVALLPWGRPPPLGRVVSIGLASGLVNNVVPARGGDLMGIALLIRECAVPATAALAAMGITSVVEAAVFGLYLLLLVVFEADRFEALLGPAEVARATSGLTALTVAVVFGSVVLVFLGRRLGRRAPGPVDGGPREWLRRALVDTGRGLGALAPLGLNAALSVAQVGCVVLSYRLLFPALGLAPPLPLLAASLYLAVGSLAAIVLPPSLAAGSAATAVAVFASFGIGQAPALAFAALTWVTQMIPVALLGIGPLWVRLGRLPVAGEAR